MTYTLDVFWRPREESAAACAAHLKEMFERLAAIHPVFAHWKQQGETEDEAQLPLCAMPPRSDELAKIFEENISRDDEDEAWPELGYSLSAWNELDEYRGTFFNAKTGAFNADLAEPNNIFFQLGDPRPENRDFLNADVLGKALIAIAESWDADWGVVEIWDDDRRSQDSEGHVLRPWAGWLTYLSPDCALEVSVPPGASSRRLRDGGLLIEVTREQFDADNPAHVAVFDAVQASLHGLQLKRMQEFRRSRIEDDDP